MVDWSSDHYQVRRLERGVYVVEIPLGAAFSLLAIAAVVAGNGEAFIAGQPGDL